MPLKAILCLCLFLILHQKVYSRPFKRPLPKVVTTLVREAKVCNELEAIGTTYARESTTITSSVSEKVVAIHFEEGQVVRKGDSLVTLSQGEENSELHSLEAQLLDVKPSFKRSQILFEKRIISKSELEEKEASLRTIEAQIKAVKERLKDRVIRAPFDGVLGFREVSPGSLVEPGDTITTLYDLSKIKMNFEVPARYLTALKPGLKVTAFGDSSPGKKFEGEISFLSPSVDPMTRLVKIRAVLDNSSGLLKPGLFMTVHLRLKSATGLVVPEEAVIRTGDAAYLYVVTKNEKGPWSAVQTRVTTGERARGLVEITGGAQKGDTIVLRGLLRGQKKSAVTVEKYLPFSLEKMPLTLHCRDEKS